VLEVSNFRHCDQRNPLLHPCNVDISQPLTTKNASPCLGRTYGTLRRCGTDVASRSQWKHYHTDTTRFAFPDSTRRY